MNISPVNMDARKNLDMRSGDTVRVHQKIQEKGKTRLQVFEGTVLGRKHGTEPGATFTVRRVSNGYGVEKIFPLYSPNIDKIEIIKRAKKLRSKLYYIRDKALKQVSKRMKMAFTTGSTTEEEDKLRENESESEIQNDSTDEVVGSSDAPQNDEKSEEATEETKSEEQNSESTEDVKEESAEKGGEDSEEVKEEPTEEQPQRGCFCLCPCTRCHGPQPCVYTNSTTWALINIKT